jgi:hypothetical protein
MQGQFCGMPCCAKASSNRTPVSPPLRTNADEHQQVLMLCLYLDVAQISTLGDHTSGWPDDLAATAHFAPTLQNQHVRIQT